MPEQNSAIGGAANENAQGQSTADTSTGANTNQNEGHKNSSSNTSNDGKQNEGRSEGKTFTQEEVNRLLANERRAAEKRAAESEAKAKLSEDQRMKAELAEARAALRERDTRETVTEAAGKAGVKNPKLFYNAYRSDLEFDEKRAKLRTSKTF